MSEVDDQLKRLILEGFEGKQHMQNQQVSVDFVDFVSSRDVIEDLSRETYYLPLKYQINLLLTGFPAREFPA